MPAAPVAGRSHLLASSRLTASFTTPGAFTLAIPRRRLVMVRAEEKEDKEKKQAEKLVKGANSFTVIISDLFNILTHFILMSGG